MHEVVQRLGPIKALEALAGYTPQPAAARLIADAYQLLAR